MKEYATKDLYFAAFLKVKGVLLLRLERVGNSTKRKFEPYYFIFEDKDCSKLEQVYWERLEESRIIAGEFASAVKDLRDRLFSIKRPRRNLNEDN